ncbi:MAG: hypothetical protein NZ889_00750 [Candidatus Pacearchaeota archaeon]|nr:hypothetical protein [Candidatus Pacearchaeota archaeon]
MLGLRKLFKKKKEREIILGHPVSQCQEEQKKEYKQDAQQELGFISDFASAISRAPSEEAKEKIERISRRLDRVIERIEVLEKKVERIENKLETK